MGRLLTLIIIAGLAYGGLYLHYDRAVTRAIETRLDGLGLSALEVERLDFAPLAPLSAEAMIAADVVYQGAEATLDLRLTGHPLFSEELRLELDSLQALRLTIGAGQP